VVRNGSSSRTQFPPKSQDDSRVAAEECSGLYQCQGLALGVQTSTPGSINCGLFWRTWLAKSVTTTWTVWKDPSWKQRQRSPWRRCDPRWQSGRSVSRLASRQREAIFSGIIINENLKLVLINYLARKVDVLFHFPSRSQYTWDRTYGRTVYNFTVSCRSHLLDLVLPPEYVHRNCIADLALH
jgi:hypothetical protein